MVRESKETQRGALQGLTILDLSRVLAGPLCTMMMADLGATVIKIENPKGGDDTRSMGPFKNGESAYYMNLNRNKLGITLDLKKPQGREIFLAMVKKADVVVENFRPGTMDKLGLGFEELKKANRRIVYGAISGFGQTGRYSRRAGYDIIAQAMSGMMSTTGWPESEPTRTGTATADVLAGLTCTIGILAALRSRDETGLGQMVDAALIDAAVSSMEVLNMVYLVTGKTPKREGNRYQLAYPFDSFKASGGSFVIGVSNNKLWTLVCQAMERPDLVTEPLFLDNSDRVQNHRHVKAVIEEWASKLSVDECCRRLEAQGVPCAPILDVAQVHADPHIAIDRQMFVPVDHPVAGRMDLTGSSLKLSETPTRITSPAPLLGQHNRDVFHHFFAGDTHWNYDELEAQGVFDATTPAGLDRLRRPEEQTIVEPDEMLKPVSETCQSAS